MSSDAEGRPAQAERPPQADGRPNDVQERLARLEQQVQRAIELIGTLRAENARLTGERRSLETRVAEVTTEAEGLRTRLGVITRLEMEQRRLLEERRQLLGQVEGILKELARIEGL
jgi:FtsZ-binding cell division protein ZapB